jgi:hypothetical protein
VLRIADREDSMPARFRINRITFNQKQGALPRRFVSLVFVILSFGYLKMRWN